jgi:hypothetical protein
MNAEDAEGTATAAEDAEDDNSNNNRLHGNNETGRKRGIALRGGMVCGAEASPASPKRRALGVTGRRLAVVISRCA